MKSSIRLAAIAAASLALSALAPRVGAAQRTFTCSSSNDNRSYCDVDTRGGVQIVRQLSRTDCIRGRTWGVADRGVWVSRGCRAEFEVGTGRNVRGDDRWDDRDDRWDSRDDRYDSRRNSNLSAGRVAALCRREVARRLGGAGVRDVRMTRGGYARNGDYLLEWQEARGRSGTCRVDSRGQEVRVNVSNRRR